MEEKNSPVRVEIAPECAGSPQALALAERFGSGDPESGLILRLDGQGLCLVWEDQLLRGDFTRLLPRLKGGRVPSELLVRAAKRKGEGPFTAVDATAGLGEDSLILAAAGFRVTMFEKNPVIFLLLRDALDRAASVPELAPIASRMQLYNADSLQAMKALEAAPDVILLDPMFPERQKSALVKKKLQMIQKLESPCMDEWELLLTAMEARPGRLIVKRPPKGPYLAGIRPDHSIEGKAVRFDCFVSPGERLHKFTQQRPSGEKAPEK